MLKINLKTIVFILFFTISIVSGLFNWTDRKVPQTKVNHLRTWTDTEKECRDWFTFCADFQEKQTDSKACFGKTLYFVPHFVSNWQSARLYCMNIFKSSPNADVLYFDTDGDDDLARFLSEFPRDDTVPTSALCCPMSIDPPAKADIECKWVYDPREALDPELYSDIAKTELDDKDCYFLRADLSTSHRNPKFISAKSISDPTDLNYICSYKLPSYCPNPDIFTTTTQRSTTKTHKPTSTTKSSSEKTTVTEPSTTTTPTTTTSGPDEKFCPELHDQHGIKVWPSVKINETSRAKCPDNFDGIAEWLCGMDGHFVPEGPHITCTRKWIKPIIKDFERVKNMDELVDGLDRFQSNITEDPVKFPDDLRQVIVVVDKVHTLFESFASKSNETDDQQVKQVAEKIVESCSKIVENDQPWDASKLNKRIEIAGQMLDYIQRSGVTVGCFAAKNRTYNWEQPISPKNNTNIYLDAFNMDERQQVSFKHLDHWFSLKKALCTNEIVSEWCPHRMGVGALFKRLSVYLFDPQEKERKKLSMNSEIIAFTYNNKTLKTSRLPDDNEAQMSLVHHERMDFGAEPRCVFWSYESKSWSSQGCHVDVKNSDRNQTTCVCNHLTNFAVLMDISNREEPSELKSILTMVTCAASIVCLMLTIMVYYVCREIRKKRTSIIVNISFIMILIDLLVIFGLDQTDHPVVCKSVSVSLLYLMLALFFWMLMEGYNLYQMMILIFDSKGRLRLLYLYLIAYGIPLLITIAGVIYMYLKTELTNEYFCWITSTKFPNQIWILAAPVTVIILINTYIMIRVMKIVLNQNKNRNSMIGVPSSSTSTSDSGSGYYRSNITNPKQRNKSRKDKLSGLYPNNNNNNNNNNDDDEQQPPPQSNQPSFEEKLSEWYSYLKGFFGLIVLMGITWISYLLYIHRYGHYFSYVFIVMNGLQGVFIFITQILMNKKARNSILRRFYQMIGKDDYSSSSSSRNTTSSYLSQQRVSKPSLGNINQTRQDNNNDDPNLMVNQDRNPINLLIDRSTSLEF